MKRLVLGIISLSACIPLLMAAAEPIAFANTFITSAALGDGSMSFGQEGEGRAWLRFSIQDGDQIGGSLIVAAEAHHTGELAAPMMFPDAIIRMSNFEKATFKDRSVRFSGQGALHNDPVRVAVVAYDNEGTNKADRFVIKCTDEKGVIVFHADGYLFRGNIQVGGE